MKKRTLGISLVLSAFALTLGAFLIPSKEAKKAEGYSASTLPTTIDLNNCDDNEIRSYYSGVSGQGNNLLISLKNRLKNGQKYYSYENGTSIWQMYEITDRDWEKSPASSTTYGNYNSSTNKITNYTYGTSSSSSKNNPYIHALYINRNVTNQTDAWSDHQQTQWGINREHVWPKAEGFDSKGAGGARGDPMHLMAGNGYANNIHSNHYYGYVNLSSSYTNCGTKYSNLNGNYSGTSLTKGGSTTVFEPQDSDKGDIARSIFYMAARYNYLSGSDSDGIDTNNPNLTLTSNLSDWSSSGYTSSATTQGKLGIIEDLLAWHHADPVDEYEIHRNNLLYKNFTNNRNPFIDFPEWADFIWGKVTYNGRNYQSYSSTPTGSANPSSDTINGYNSGGCSVAVTGVSLDKSSLSLYKGDTATLVATVSPSDATNKSVTWSSSNTSTVTVSNLGVVTAKAAGSATITVTTADGNKTASCTVTVSNPPKTLSSISVSGQKTEFEMDEEFSFGGTVTATYSDNSQANVTSSCSFDGFDSSIVGEQDITVSYTYSGKTETTQYTVTIKAPSSVVIEDFVSSEEGFADKEVVTTIDKTNYSLAFDSGTNTSNEPKYYVVGESIRLYGGNTMTVSSDLNIVGIEFTFGDGEGTNDILCDSGTYSEGSWIGAAKSVKFTIDGTKGQRRIAKLTITLSTSEQPIPSSSITASVSRDFFASEVITKDDVTVRDNLGRLIKDFTFNNFLFEYEDVVGGNTSTEFTFDIDYLELETTLVVNVQRRAFTQASSPIIEIIPETHIRGQIANSYAEGQTALIDEVSYDIDGYYFAGSKALSLSTQKTKAPGFIENSSPLPIPLTGVSVTGENPDIQVGIDKEHMVDLSSANFASNDYLYFKIYYKNTTVEDYTNITKITLSFKNKERARTLSDYVMFEDTENQCSSGGKFANAKSYFEGMIPSERSRFMSSEDYVYVTARERFIAWATHEGKSIDLINGDYVVSGAKTPSIFGQTFETPTLVIIVIASVGIAALGGYLFIRRYKQK